MDYISYSKKIDNSEVRFYFDSALKKVTENIKKRNNSEELYYWANNLFQKFKIQFYSIMKLTYEKTYDLENKYEYFDIVSISTLIRGCYETFLIFEYIYIQSNNIDEINMKILFYKLNGYKDQASIVLKNTEDYKTVNEKIKNTKEKIYKNNIFKQFNEEYQKKLFESWKPSWNEIAKKIRISDCNERLSDWNSRKQYNLLCQHSHGSFASLLLIDYYYKNLDKYDFDAINCQLYQTTTLFINDILRLFKLNIEIFEKEEIGLMQEFLYMSTLGQKSLQDSFT